MGFKVSVELDESKLKSQGTHAAGVVKSAFDTVNPTGNIPKKAQDAFRQVEQYAKSSASNISSQFQQRTSPFARMTQHSKAAFDSVVKHAQAAGSAIGAIAKNALGVFGGNILTSGLSRITGLLTEGVEKGIAYNSNLEVMRIRFAGLVGDAGRANKELEILKKLADTTPFTFPDLAETALTLQSMGFTVDQVETGMRGIIDAASRAGGTPEALKSIGLILGQINQSGSLLNEDLRQLQQRGIPALDILAKAAGKTTEEFRDLMQQGVISGQAAAKALVDAFLIRPDIAGQSELIAQTFTGKLSTLADKVESVLGRAAEKAQSELKDTLDKTLALLEGPNAERMADRLKPLFAAPITALNKSLEILASDDPASTVAKIGADQGKALTDAITSAVTTGLNKLYTEALTPLLQTIKQAISDTFAGVKKEITDTFEGIKKQILDTFRQFKVPGLGGLFGGSGEKTSLEGVSGGDAFGITVTTMVQTPRQSGESQREAVKRILQESKGKTKTQLDQIIGTGTQTSQSGTVLPSTVPLSSMFGLGDFAFRGMLGGTPSGIPIGAAAAALQVENVAARATGGVEAFREATKDIGPLIRQASDQADQFSSTLADATGTFFDALIVGAQGVGGAFKAALNVGRQAVAQIFSQGVSQLFGGLFGGGGGGAAGGSSGGGAGGFFSGIIGKLFGGGGAGGGGGFNFGNLFRTAPFAGGNFGSLAGGSSAAGLGNAAGLPLNILNTQGLLSSIGITQGTSSLAGIGLGGVGGLAGILGPALLGGALGSALGGQSTAGRILGAVGGGAVGIGALFGATVFGAGGGLGAAALAALGPIGLIGIPLLIGAILLGKAKQRKSDEQSADAIWVAEMNATRELIAGVKGDRIEGSDALAQFAILRQQTLAQLSQIKTKSVRESRIKNQLADLDRTVVAELRTAVEQQALRRSRQQKLVPQFDRGGMMPEDGFAYLHEGEAVVTRQQQAKLGGARALAEAGVPGASSAAIDDSGAQTINLEVALIIDENEAAGIVAKGVKNSTGRRSVVNVVRRGRVGGERGL